MSDDQVQIPFSGGPDETVDPRSLPPGSVISLRNANYDQEGMYQLRPGYTFLTGASMGTGLSSGIKRLHTFGGEMLANDGTNLWTFNDQTTNWATKDAVPQLAVTHAPIQNSTSTFQSWSEATGSGYRIVAWIDNVTANAYAAIYSLATGALVQGPTQLAGAGSAINIRVGVVGTTAIAVAAISGLAQINGWTANLAPLSAWTGAATVLSDANLTVTTGTFAVAFMSATFAISFQNGASGANQTIRTISYNAALTLQQNVNGNSTTLTGPFVALASRGTTGENLWIACAPGSGATVKVMCINPSTLAAVAGPLAFTYSTNVPAAAGTVAALAIERMSSTQCLLVSDPSSVGQSFVSWAQFTTAGQVGTSSGCVGVSMASQPLAIAAMSTAIMLARTNVQLASTLVGSHVLLDLQTAVTSVAVTPRWLATLTPLQNNLLAPPNICPSLIVNPSTGVFETVAPIVRGSGGRQGMELFTFKLQDASQWSAAFLGRELYLGGSYYDSKAVVENGYAQPPQTSLVNNAGAGVNYQYCCTWGRVNAQGNLEESAPGPILSVTSGAPPNVAVTNFALHATNKQRAPLGVLNAFPTPPVFQIVYRTPNLAAGDTTLYRVTKEPFPANCLNVTNAGTILYTDTMSDATLTDGTHPPLYTTSGELPHNPPETPTHVITHKNRVWQIGADQRTVWYSQTYSDGVMPSWSPLQTVTVDDLNEPLTALGSLYDKILLFSKTRIYVTYGDGPSINGAGNDIVVPQRVISSSGCIDPRSVVSTPLGVMFQSQRGIELVTPGLDVQFIGLPVSVTTATYPICTSAVLAENSSTVRFTMVQAETNPSTGTGLIVVYDLRRQRWTFHSVQSSAANGNQTPDQPIQAAVYHPTYGYSIAYNGVSAVAVGREAAPTETWAWTDFLNFGVPLSITTAWIKSGDLQGWQRLRRVRLLAQYFDVHSLSASFDYDYQATGEAHNFTQAQVTTLAARTVQGPVASSGTNPPAVTLTLTRQTAGALSVEIDITSNGNQGVAQFQWKLGGVVQQTGQLTATTFVLGTTGLTANFPIALYTNDNVYTSVPTVVETGEQIRFTPGQGKCEAFRANWTMQPPGSCGQANTFTGRGCAFTGMAFEIHRKRGGYRNLGQAAKA